MSEPIPNDDPTADPSSGLVALDDLGAVMYYDAYTKQCWLYKLPTVKPVRPRWSWLDWFL